MRQGFWEKTSTDGFNLSIQGWAFSEVDGPIDILMSDDARTVAPLSVTSKNRPDVVEKFPSAPLESGFTVVFDYKAIGQLDRASAHLLIVDASGKTTRIKNQPADTVWNALRFSDHAEFSVAIQNPAFRVKSLPLQVFASLVAREHFRDDKIIRPSALVVLMYRVVTGEFTSPELLEYCNANGATEFEQYEYRAPIEFRWKVSLGMALGYLFLHNDDPVAAAKVFGTLARLSRDIALWPAMATNVVTAILLACVLNPEENGNELLRTVPETMKQVIGEAPLDNFYQYEEHVNLVRACAQCAAQLAGREPAPNWVGPTRVDWRTLTHIPNRIRDILLSGAHDRDTANAQA